MAFGGLSRSVGAVSLLGVVSVASIDGTGDVSAPGKSDAVGKGEGNASDGWAVGTPAGVPVCEFPSLV